MCSAAFCCVCRMFAHESIVIHSVTFDSVTAYLSELSACTNLREGNVFNIYVRNIDMANLDTRMMNSN